MKPPRRESKRRNSEPAPTILTRWDKLQIWGVIAVVVLGVVGVLTIRIHNDQRAFNESLTRTLNRWRHRYHLDDARVNRIREIELAFHGNGNFLTVPSRTAEEKFHHSREIAAVMNPEDGTKFLADQEKH